MSRTLYEKLTELTPPRRKVVAVLAAQLVAKGRILQQSQNAQITSSEYNHDHAADEFWLKASAMECHWNLAFQPGHYSGR